MNFYLTVYVFNEYDRLLSALYFAYTVVKLIDVYYKI